MSQHLQQHDAAASSARSRRTARLLRELHSCRPLTESQRDALVSAAAAIPVVTR
jgi:hypothetical protein